MRSIMPLSFSALKNTHTQKKKKKKMAFGADIKISIDVDGCLKSKPVRCLYRIMFMRNANRQIMLFS